MLTPELIEQHTRHGISANEAEAYAADNIFPADAPKVSGRIALANESLFNQAFFSRPLSAYATGWKDRSPLDVDLDFYAPRVAVNRRFEYAVWNNAEEFYSETADDIRAIRGDFKQVEYTESKVQAKTENRGLTMRIDLDEVAEKSGWQEVYTGKLIRRLRRNALRRALALLSAAATNTAKTWDTTSGKDPDNDVLAELLLAGDSSGVRPNRVGYGETAWTKRVLAHRAQNSAGGFASAGSDEKQVAAFLGVERVHRTSARFQSSAAAKTQIVGNRVFMFNAGESPDVEDPSNIKRFITPTPGGDFGVYVQQVSAKLYDITVEHYELLKMTSLLGVRLFTVS